MKSSQTRDRAASLFSKDGETHASDGGMKGDLSAIHPKVGLDVHFFKHVPCGDELPGLPLHRADGGDTGKRGKLLATYWLAVFF